jgi:membrane protease YdiL (CAAX protease family)
MAAGGLLAGLIVERTGSLAIPIAAHVGLDIPLYYGNACRLPS